MKIEIGMKVYNTISGSVEVIAAINEEKQAVFFDNSMCYMDQIVPIDEAAIEAGRLYLKVRYEEARQALKSVENSPEFNQLVAEIEEYYFGEKDVNSPELKVLEAQYDQMVDHLQKAVRGIKDECLDFLIEHVSKDFEHIKRQGVGGDKALKILFK